MKILLSIIIIFFINISYAKPNIDQWKNTKKTYKDLIDDGYKVKAYDALNISSENGLTILLFITVLQKEKKIFECQEYQTLDENMITLDMSFICKELSQPRQIGLGT